MTVQRKKVSDVGSLYESQASLSMVLDVVAPIGLVGCLTKALCCECFCLCCQTVSSRLLYLRLDINRAIATSSTSSADSEGAVVSVDPRILVLSVSPDQSSTYIPIMNSIFSAQKLVRKLMSC